MNAKETEFPHRTLAPKPMKGGRILVLVETIGSHNCSGYRSGLPGVIKNIAEETGVVIEHKDYPAYSIDEQTDVPEHVRLKVENIRKGTEPADGVFINGTWIRLSPHNTGDAVAARKAVLNAIGATGAPGSVTRTAMEFGDVKSNFNDIRNIYLGDSKVGELGSFSTHYEKIWFFEGSIKKLSIDCAVDNLTYRGFDINRLVEVALKHPELMNPPDGEVTQRAGKQQVKVNLDEITVHLLGQDDLARGWHPCFLTDHHIDPNSRLHRLAAESFGGWGYVAKHGDHPCAFVGVLPKDLAYEDAQGFLPPGDSNHKTLLLTCFIGGGNYGPQYAGVGITKKIVKRAMADARAKGYTCIEGNPHDEGIGPLLEKCGFTRIEWPGSADTPQRERAYYRILL